MSLLKYKSVPSGLKTLNCYPAQSKSQSSWNGLQRPGSVVLIFGYISVDHLGCWCQHPTPRFWLNCLSAAKNLGFFKASCGIAVSTGVWVPLPCLTSPDCRFWDLSSRSFYLAASAAALPAMLLASTWPPGFYFCCPLGPECSSQYFHMAPCPTSIWSFLEDHFISAAFPDPCPPPWCPLALFSNLMMTFPVIHLFTSLFMSPPLHPTISPMRAALCLVHDFSA